MNTITQNRSDNKDVFDLSNRLKRYGANLSVLDLDTEEATFQVLNRGVFAINFEFKSAWFDGSTMRGPKVPFSQQLAMWFSVQPSFLAYYSDDWCYRVSPANYAAVVWCGSRDTKMMTEEEFQVLFSSVSPCAPSGELNKIKYQQPTEFIFFKQYEKDLTFDAFSFAGIKHNIDWYKTKNNYIEDAWSSLKERLPEEIYLAHIDLWNQYSKKASVIK